MWQNGVYLLNGNGEFSDKYSTMPTASIGFVGKIVQYTGTTGGGYTNGYFYKGIATNMPSVATIGIGTSTGITEASIVKATFEGLITASGTYDFVFSASTASADIGVSTGITASSVVVATFETLLTATGDYVFTFDGSDWKYDGSAVTLSDYGISVTGTPNENDTVTVSYVKADWKYDGDIVTLSDYGITAVGTPDDQDTISVVYAVAYVAYSWLRIDVQPAGSTPSDSTTTFAVKSSNVDSNGLTDIASINEIINVGCSATAGVVTGGENKYLQLTKVAPINTADSWEIKTKYTHVTGATKQCIFGWSGVKDWQVPVLYVESDAVKLYASSTGESWDLFSEQSLNLTLTTTNTYYLKLSYDSVTGYKFEHSADDISYSTDWTDVTTTKSVFLVPMIFLNIPTILNWYSAGSIDLNETVITIDSAVWFSYSETISFKIDDGTLYAPLTIVSADGTETTLTSVSDLDLSSFADGRINIFFGASGAVAYNNTIFNQTNQPTPNATNDIWFNNLNEAKKWSGSAWVATDLVFGLYIIKNGILETYGNVPLNYNGKGEVLAKSYNSTTEHYDIWVRPQFNFYIVQYGVGITDSVSGLITLPIYTMLNTYYCPTLSYSSISEYTYIKTISRNNLTIKSSGGVTCYWRVEGYIA